MTIPRIEPYPLPERKAVPASKVDWPLVPARAVLLVHDMQCYFADFFPEASALRATLVAHISALCDAARKAGVPCVFTAQPEHAPVARRGLLGDMWGPGLSAHTGRAGLVPPLAPGDGDVLLPKLRYSAYFATDLAERMARWGRDQLWICGIYAHIGGLVTAHDAFMRDHQPFLIADAVAAFSRADHDTALALVARTTGRVTTTEEHLRALAGHGRCAKTVAVPTALATRLGELLDCTPDLLVADADLRALGMDSVRLLELFEWLEGEGHAWELADLLACNTVGEVAGLLEGQAPAWPDPPAPRQQG